MIRSAHGDRPIERFARGQARFSVQKGHSMLKTPDFMILGSAFLSFLLSVSLWFGVIGEADKDAGLFVGLWVPSILGVGVYFVVRSQRR